MSHSLENNITTLLSKSNSKPFLMTHLVAGYPTQKDSLSIAKALIDSGADILEIQIPFSDPMADGPTITKACNEALAGGIKVRDVLVMVKLINNASVPIVIMSYANIIFNYGIACFVKDAALAGASGIIIPDLPVDTKEGQELITACKKYNVCPIIVISPGVSKERLKVLSHFAEGFVYCTSRQGITGANGNFAKNLGQYLTEVKNIMKLPLAVGFGVKSTKDVKSISRYAQIVVAGSVFISAMQRAKTNNFTKTVSQTMKMLKG